jgi:hypothetical protein
MTRDWITLGSNPDMQRWRERERAAMGLLVGGASGMPILTLCYDGVGGEIWEWDGICTPLLHTLGARLLFGLLAFKLAWIVGLSNGGEQ